MHFAEAEQKYRELEDRLLSGALTDDDFVSQVAQLRVVDEAGRRWTISARTGRWLLHDGQQWVFAEPPRGQAQAPVAVTAPSAARPAPHPAAQDAETVARVEKPDAAPEAIPVQPARSRSLVPRLLVGGL